MATNLFPMLARFSAWASGEIYDACATLSDQARKADRKAFFGSIHHTLNHLLVVDKCWMARIEGVESGLRGLDQILYDDFDALRAERRREDDHLIALVDGLDDVHLAAPVHYRFLSGTAASTPCEIILATLFNHQTHHRGQIHAMLSQAGVAPPEIDIIEFPGHLA